jgi:hypothetical protein
MKPNRQGESLPPASIFSQCSRTTNLRNTVTISLQVAESSKTFPKGTAAEDFFFCSFQTAPTQPLIPGASLVTSFLKKVSKQFVTGVNDPSK